MGVEWIHVAHVVSIADLREHGKGTTCLIEGWTAHLLSVTSKELCFLERVVN